MLSQTMTQIMNQVNKLPPQSRLRMVQLTLDTLIEPTNEPSPFSKSISIRDKIGFVV